MSGRGVRGNSARSTYSSALFSLPLNPWYSLPAASPQLPPPLPISSPTSPHVAPRGFSWRADRNADEASEQARATPLAARGAKAGGESSNGFGCDWGRV